MIGKTAEQRWGAALSMSPGNLIDKFLDWVEELGRTMLPAHDGALVRIEERRESFRA